VWLKLTQNSSIAESAGRCDNLIYMMRQLLLFISLATFLGCAQTKRPVPQGEKYYKLLSKFKEISFDTLFVYSLNDEVTLENYEFKGIKLDSSDAILFPEKISHAHFVDPPGLFACYKFKIDSTRTGIIARTPSEYFPSSIKLFIYTLGKDTLIESNELAQFIGDAGALRNINSWIFRDTQGFKAFTWLRDSEDNSVENEKDTTISVSDYFSLYDITKDKRDSIGRHISQLPSKFVNLLKGKPAANKNSYVKRF